MQEFLYMWVIASRGMMPLWTFPAWLLHPQWTLFACCFSKQTVQRASKTNPQPLKPTQKLRSELLTFRCTLMEESWTDFISSRSRFWWKLGTHPNPTGRQKTRENPSPNWPSKQAEVWTDKNVLIDSFQKHWKPTRKWHTQHMIGSFSDSPPFCPTSAARPPKSRRAKIYISRNIWMT